MLSLWSLWWSYASAHDLKLGQAEKEINAYFPDLAPPGTKRGRVLRRPLRPPICADAVDADVPRPKTKNKAVRKRRP